MFLDFTNIEDNDTNKMMIFCAEWGKQLLKKTPAIYIDGTFRKAPSPFRQVYIVMAEAAFSRAVPVAYVLMTERTESAYATLFNRLSQYIGEKRTFHVNVDFELGVIKAIKRVFPQARISGCYFHFVKALKLKLRKMAKRKLIKRSPFIKKGEIFFSYSFESSG